VNKTILFPVLLICCLAAGAFGQSATPPGKVGILNIQGAIAGTQQGQKAAADLQSRYEPKRRELERGRPRFNHCASSSAAAATP